MSTVARMVPTGMPRNSWAYRNTSFHSRTSRGFRFRQVEVRAASAVQQSAGIVKEVQAEVHEGAHRRLVVHKDVPFVQVPATWTYDKSCETTFVEPVGLAFGRLKGQAPAHASASATWLDMTFVQ
jgi:hypothetical protein